MSKNIMSWLSITILTITHAISQNIENNDLSISFQKTTSIVFPFSITSVDRGSRDVLAQKATGVENVLQVKAGRRNFPETNLTVITSDGILHEFTVNYSEAPATQTVNVVALKDPDPNSLVLAHDIINARDLQFVSDNVLKQAEKGRVAKYSKYQMVFALQDIFIQNDIMFYRIQIRNKSAVNYDIKSLKFIVKDRKKVKRTSSQEVDLIPVYIENESQNVRGYASSTIVYALRKFTIPDRKTLHINLFEENGGRHLNLKVDNKDILKARSLPVNKNLLTIN
jgi:conjugative transposon TraN protein